jgi:hypothetical protein
VDGWEAAGAGAGVAAGAGVSGVCAPAIKANASAVPAMVCSMRFGFIDIGTIPPKKNLFVLHRMNSAKKQGQKAAPNRCNLHNNLAFRAARTKLRYGNPG